MRHIFTKPHPNTLPLLTIICLSVFLSACQSALLPTATADRTEAIPSNAGSKPASALLIVGDDTQTTITTKLSIQPRVISEQISNDQRSHQSAEQLEKEIVQGNDLGRPELDTQPSTNTAADLLAEAYQTPDKKPTLVALEVMKSAEQLAKEIVQGNDLDWSELDTQSSTNTAADLLAEAYQTPDKKPTPVALEVIKEDLLVVQPVPLDLDLWQLTVTNFQLNHIEHPRIQPHYKWFSKHQEYMRRVTTRASRYYHYVLHTTLDKSLPAEIALLPIIESGFDTFAYSSGRAAGAWQFIPSTGRVFGLKQNWWYDGRRDIVASTQAAQKYLTQLHKMFDGDWLLAIASYNGGQGTVLKAIKRNKKAGKPTDFWSLDLPKETMNYVPKLLAVAKVVAQQAGTNSLFSVKDEPYFKSINVGSQIDLAQAADMAQITTDEIYRLNPGFNQWATDPQGPHQLLIPVAHVDKFNTALQNQPANQRVAWERYKIQPGDSLLKLAHRYHISVGLLRTINNIDGNMIRAGKTLMIPIASQEAEAYTLSAAQRVISRQKQIAQTQASNRVIYTVKSGDSLWKIAKQYKVSVKQVASWNKIGTKSLLQIGDKINVWPRATAKKLGTVQRNVIKKLSYKVRSGDNLSAIAYRFSITVKDIQKWNQALKKYLQPGQKLTLYVDVTKLKQ